MFFSQDKIDRIAEKELLIYRNSLEKIREMKAGRLRRQRGYLDLGLLYLHREVPIHDGPPTEETLRQIALIWGAEAVREVESEDGDEKISGSCKRICCL